MTKAELLQLIEEKLPANDKIYTKTGVVRELLNEIAGECFLQTADETSIFGLKNNGIRKLFPEIPNRIDPAEGGVGYRGIVEHVYGFLGYYNGSDSYQERSIDTVYGPGGTRLNTITVNIPPQSWGYFDMIRNEFYYENGPFEIPFVEVILHNSFYYGESGWAIFGLDANGETAMIADNIVDARIENFKRVQVDFETFNVPYPLWTVTRRL